MMTRNVTDCKWMVHPYVQSYNMSSGLDATPFLTSSVRTPEITVEIIAWYKKCAKSTARYKMYIEVRSECKMYLEVSAPPSTFCTRYVPLCTFCTGPTQKRALGQGDLCECRCISTAGARVVWELVGVVPMICPIALFLVGFEPTTCCL
jgi:hypothetical protein